MWRDERDVAALCAELAPRLVAWRRDVHAWPETAWREYRTAALVARQLRDLGYGVRLGREAMCPEARAPVDAGIDARERARAVAEGADAALVEQMRGGCTALWAEMPLGRGGGPLVALRFDMDANGVGECAAPDHAPAREGFASRHPGVMHACGHDAHIAMGLGVATILKRLGEAWGNALGGRVRLLFQPAEESGQGARAMVLAGAVEGVDVLVGLHIGMSARALGEVVCGTTGFLATTTFEAEFHGQAAHAGMAPQKGRNALMAACAAVTAMQGISRHGEGASRVNVGQFRAEGAGNVVPAHAWIAGETRGHTDAIDAWMLAEAERMAEGAAHMWGCTHDFRQVSHCPGGGSDAALTARVERVARAVAGFDAIVPTRDFGASEDFTWFVQAVQRQGGQCAHIQLGTGRPAGHHTERFDLEEAALPLGVELLTRLVCDLVRQP